MTEQLIEAMRALAGLIGHETRLLMADPASRDLAALSRQSAALAADLNARLAGLGGEGSHGLAALSPDMQAALAGALNDLDSATRTCRAARQRQVALSLELVGAINAEADRAAIESRPLPQPFGHLLPSLRVVRNTADRHG
jgi:hypothetical protein